MRVQVRNFKSFKEIEKSKHSFLSEWRRKVLLLVELRVIKSLDQDTGACPLSRYLDALIGKVHHGM